jgi:DNA-binding NtrC family response regulator/tetratricopeptide (TPR) repeat protein
VRGPSGEVKLFRRYRLVGRPVDGAPRQVIVALDRLTGVTCVLKYVPATSAGAGELVAEGQLLAQLSHPGLVVFHDHFVDVPGPFGEGAVTGFAMRWVDGVPLTTGAPALDTAGRVKRFSHLLDVVDYMHRRGILHLDLKPANVVATDAGVVLLDLGSSRPRDDRPGQAGGTLGYAAPEVLAGQAASVSADVYSLGAILYQLLTGMGPFGDVSGAELRRAALSGSVIPVRAVEPGTPPVLAQLAERMLARDPAVRIHSVDAVMEQLERAGFSISRTPGSAPFLGRDAVFDQVGALLARPGGGVIAVVGPAESGRTRLIRRLFRSPPGPGRRLCFDFSEGVDPVQAIDGLANLAGADLPPPGLTAGWQESVTPVLRGWAGGPSAVYLGRRTRISPDVLRVLDDLVPALAQGGFQVVWATTDSLPGASNVVLRPMEDEAMAALSRFHGASSAARARELATRAGGWPGPLVRALAPRIAVAAPKGPAIATLSALPAGVPRSAFAALPDAWRLEVVAAVSRGEARWAPDGRLYLDGVDGTAAERLPDRLNIARWLSQVPVAEFGVWFALAVARLGDLEEAARRLTTLDDGTGRRADRLELAERLAASGDLGAISVLAGLREDDGDLGAAEVLLASLQEPTPSDVARRVRVLRRARRLDEADHLAREALDRHPTADLWLEMAHVQVGLRNIEQAEAACAAADALAPNQSEVALLGLRITIALKKRRSGADTEGLASLLARVEERAPAGGLPSYTVSGAGRLLALAGELARGETLLALAGRLADEEGDAQRSAGVRLNQANVLQRLGRGREARRAYREALAIAEAVGDTEIILRVRYSLAGLELRSGRLPAAETEAAAFLTAVGPSGGAEARARATELKAQVLLARDRPEEALACLQTVTWGSMPADLRVCRDMVRAKALLALGRPSEVLDVLQDTPATPVPANAATLAAIRGRTHLGLARKLLAEARALLPDDPDPLLAIETGEVLLAWAGEDIDPDSLVERRAALDRAARMLRGQGAARAATLRDRLLDGPGASLDGIVRLTEAMNDTEAFPRALAELVGQALGAYRVLIMMPMPGLGRQVTYTELSGQEAAGIGNEVLRRIQKPDDFWLAHDAFADPHLRETSATVRTFELKSLVAVAIPRGERAVGALYVDDLHRANRFGPDDVAVLQRLAKAVGHMMPLIGAAERSAVLAEPQDLLGVLVADRGRIEEIEYATTMLRGAKQTNLLITGPTGAGKSVLARRLATDVLKLDGVEVVVMRQGDPQMLITQLTGARRGEFTGSTDREGAIQRCLKHGRALFLDEVQDLDDAGQQILLPLLELGQRHFAGLTSGNQALPGKLHVILGTNAAVARGQWKQHFREDLWYRMSAIRLDLPTLAARGVEAVYRYLAQMLDAEGGAAPEAMFETQALHRATHWSWPGNLRQLHTFAVRAAQLHPSLGRAITLRDLPWLGIEEDDEISLQGGPAGPTDLDNVVHGHVMDVLHRNGWKQKAAAAELKRSAAWLNKYLGRKGLLDDVRRFRQEHRDG